MEEIVVKVDIPAEFKQDFKLALARIVESLIKEIEFSMVKGVISKSRFSEEDVIELSRDVNKSLHKRYKKLYSGMQ